MLLFTIHMGVKIDARLVSLCAIVVYVTQSKQGAGKRSTSNLTTLDDRQRTRQPVLMLTESCKTYDLWTALTSFWGGGDSPKFPPSPTSLPAQHPRNEILHLMDR